MNNLIPKPEFVRDLNKIMNDDNIDPNKFDAIWSIFSKLNLSIEERFKFLLKKNHKEIPTHVNAKEIEDRLSIFSDVYPARFLTSVRQTICGFMSYREEFSKLSPEISMNEDHNILVNWSKDDILCIWILRESLLNFPGIHSQIIYRTKDNKEDYTYNLYHFAPKLFSETEKVLLNSF